MATTSDVVTLQAEAERVGAYYVYVTSISREAINDPTLLAADGTVLDQARR